MSKAAPKRLAWPGGLDRRAGLSKWRGFRKRFDRHSGFTRDIGTRLRALKRHGRRYVSCHAALSDLSFNSGEIRNAIQGRGYLTQQTQAVYT